MSQFLFNPTTDVIIPLTPDQVPGSMLPTLGGTVFLPLIWVWYSSGVKTQPDHAAFSFFLLLIDLFSIPKAHIYYTHYSKESLLLIKVSLAH